MTTYYVGIGGDDGNAGTSWAARKLTLNGAEDIPVAAGDTVYVGPGTYRELLTVDVSGSSGSPITYIGDYKGSNTDGVGGVVRITGSDDDITATRDYCIYAYGSGTRTYREFEGFCLDTASLYSVSWFRANDGVYFRNCWIEYVYASEERINLQSCFIGNYRYFTTRTNNHVIENCVFIGDGRADSVAIQTQNCTGTIIKNCLVMNYVTGIASNNGDISAYNNIILNCGTGLTKSGTGTFTEDYNNIYLCSTDRVNVSVGANSISYPPLFDTRWFFELVHGGKMLSAFDLASYSELVDVAGTSPTTTDMRGTSAIGGVRELGALEYDSTLDIEAGTGGGGAVKIIPITGKVGL